MMKLLKAPPSVENSLRYSGCPVGVCTEQPYRVR
jgi:hypothetical protein